MGPEDFPGVHCRLWSMYGCSPKVVGWQHPPSCNNGRNPLSEVLASTSLFPTLLGATLSPRRQSVGHPSHLTAIPHRHRFDDIFPPLSEKPLVIMFLASDRCGHPSSYNVFSCVCTAHLSWSRCLDRLFVPSSPRPFSSSTVSRHLRGKK